MQDGLRHSKTATQQRDQLESDNSLGYVGLQEIQNVFTERLRQLDVEVWPKGERMPGRDELIEFFTTMKIELFQRAGRNYRDYCKRNPEPRTKQAPGAPQDDTTRAEYEARKSRLSRFHT